MTFADLSLPLATGHGLWSRSTPVVDANWPAAENTLATQAKDYIDTDPRGALVGGYHVVRNETAKTLTLDLMRG